MVLQPLLKKWYIMIFDNNIGAERFADTAYVYENFPDCIIQQKKNQLNYGTIFDVYLQNNVHEHKSDFFCSSVENEYLRKIEFNL